MSNTRRRRDGRSLERSLPLAAAGAGRPRGAAGPRDRAGRRGRARHAVGLVGDRGRAARPRSGVVAARATDRPSGAAAARAAPTAAAHASQPFDARRSPSRWSGPARARLGVGDSAAHAAGRRADGWRAGVALRPGRRLGDGRVGAVRRRHRPHRRPVPRPRRNDRPVAALKSAASRWISTVAAPVVLHRRDCRVRAAADARRAASSA